MISVVNKRFEPGDVYGGRPSRFENQVILGQPCIRCDEVHGRDAAAIVCTAVVLVQRLETDASFLSDVLDLDGKTVSCWCKPAWCHLDLIADFVEAYTEREAICLADDVRADVAASLAFQSGVKAITCNVLAQVLEAG